MLDQVARLGMSLEEAAMVALSVPVAYNAQGSHLGLAALAGRREFLESVHHPKNDVIDRQSGARFYYHAHPTLGTRSGEHGHFHLFHEDGSGFSHLAVLSMDVQGNPRAWACTNQWVTGEHWRPMSDWAGLLSAYQVQARGRLAPIARWLTAMTKLYEQELLGLLRERDLWLEGQRCLGKSVQEIWDDQRVYFVCTRDVALGERVAQCLDENFVN
jgi:hypothetical protein